MLKRTMGAVRRLALAMHWASGVFLIVMIVTVLLDIVTRTVFGATAGAVDLTFRGGIEIVSYGLLFMILFALPYSVSRGQVVVDLFTEGLNERAKAILGGIYIIGFGLLGLGMAIRFVEAADRVAQTGETTQDLLIPMSFFYGVAGFAATILVFRGVLVGIEQLLRAGRRF